MTLDEMIVYTNSRLAESKMELSDIGLDYLTKRWKQKEDQGGFSPYWKEVALEDIPRYHKIK